jgi:predicted flap endonuclease-1-like 5' DNA nuclease
LASLRKRLSAQHAETRVEQKNNELLRAEIAQLKNQVGLLEKTAAGGATGSAPASDSSPPADIRPSQWPALQKANTKHAQDLERIRSEHRVELDKLRSNHAMELANLKKSLFSPSAAASNDESAKLSELEAKYEARLDALRRRLRDAEHMNGMEKIEELEKALEAEKAKTAGKSVSNAPGGGDDLTRLKGVGPAIAKSLKQEGVTTFAQIAAWTPEDVEAIAPRIKTTVARIKKNRWIEAARELA